MKRHVLLAVIFGIASLAMAQNVGIGTNDPEELLHLKDGNIKVVIPGYIQSCTAYTFTATREHLRH